MKRGSLIVLSAVVLLWPGVVRGGVIAYYAFDDDSSDRLSTDSSPGGSNHAVLTGEAGHVASDLARPGDYSGNLVLALDGSDEEFAEPPYLGLYENHRQTGFTLSLWVRGSEQADQRFFTEGGPDGDGMDYYSLGTGNGQSIDQQLRFLAFDSGAFDQGLSTTMLADNAWHHVAWTHVESGGIQVARLYIDGQLDATDFNHTHVPTELGRTIIGGWAGDVAGFSWAGELDDFAAFDEVLTPGQIRALADGSRTPLTTHAPEPATLALLSAGALLALRRRRKTAIA